MPLQPSEHAPSGPSPELDLRPSGQPAAARASDADPLRKPVNALAIVPQSRRITPLFRKSYNVMLHLAQQQGLEREVYRAPVSAVLAGVDFDSNDTALVKRHLRAMATTAVEWQSPTRGEGAGWAISGLIGHAEIKRERGQNWLEWSYSVKLKQELLEPSVFARLSIEIIAQLRSHGGIALYEICSRYRDVGRSARQHWTWWRPVLSGKPETDKQRQLEYRFFKRDVLKKAVAEVNAVTDLEVALLEYKEGRFIADLQFTIRRKAARPRLPGPQPAPTPLDLSLVARAVALGVEAERAEQLLAEHGDAALRQGLDTLDKRLATAFPEPLRDPYRYLRSVLPGVQRPLPLHDDEPAAAATRPWPTRATPGRRRGQDERAAASAGPAGGGARAEAGAHATEARAGQGGAPPFPAPVATPPLAVAPMRPLMQAAASAGTASPATGPGADRHGSTQARRRDKWAEEWLRRRRERIVDDIASLGADVQRQLCESLLLDMQARNLHPSIRKRLQTSGWQHAMVLHEMVRFYARASIGEAWDQPTAAELLEVAAQTGDNPTDTAG